ncbi:carbohydrate ABC transporter membrane protein 1, CUT1 family [Paenibacillus sp. 1_12]|uniref:carbohydrate ABC transporter permease n=1 Tax=Paenibacillus sp. 1_12 TaxID=1566278 RepID=UPI0008E1F05A|nr:sugar ABC transporter permease [Paenibacillus sp. 1_12]SFK99553.1 carbohydrate ABC transporter membrane protein 1, CUT1 family [Paenibacillus sp. 1_12]
MKLKDYGAAYLFLTPWLIGLFVFSLFPIAASLYLSFTSYDMLNPPVWSGMENFHNIFTDKRFFQSLQVTLTYVLFGVPMELIFALTLAIVLNYSVSKAVNVYRGIYYIPSLIGGSVSVALLWRQIFGSDGLINQGLEWFGVAGTSWIANPSTALITIIILKVWQFGSPMVIFLAGLKQIPKELYEAAEIDGAGRRQSFFQVTLPLLTPVILFNLIMQLIGSFQAFTPAYIISGGNGGPVNSTLFYTLYLYQQGFQNYQMGTASAMAWILLLLIALFSAVTFWSSRRWVHYME